MTRLDYNNKRFPYENSFCYHEKDILKFRIMSYWIEKQSWKQFHFLLKFFDKALFDGRLE